MYERLKETHLLIFSVPTREAVMFAAPEANSSTRFCGIDLFVGWRCRRYVSCFNILTGSHCTMSRSWIIRSSTTSISSDRAVIVLPGEFQNRRVCGRVVAKPPSGLKRSIDRPRRAALCGSGDHLVGLFKRSRDRFFHENMNAGLQQTAGDFAM